MIDQSTKKQANSNSFYAFFDFLYFILSWKKCDTLVFFFYIMFGEVQIMRKLFLLCMGNSN